MHAMQFRTVNSPVGPLTLAGKDGRLMHLVMVDQAHEPSHGGWERRSVSSGDRVPMAASPGTAVGWNEKGFCWNSKEAGLDPDPDLTQDRGDVLGAE
jgi:hypothetical protein